MVDADDREYLDGLSGLWNVALGHGREELAQAARDQMAELGYCSGYAGSSNLRAIELAEKLAKLTYPSITRFFFTSGGGEASETSFKVARSYWKLRGFPNKTKVISRQWGYHGVTLGGNERHRNLRLLASVRASCARVCPDSLAVSLPLSAPSRRKSGYRRRR